MKSEVLSTPKPNGFVASATRQSGSPSVTKRSEPRIQNEAWQNAAWNWFDTIGEYRYSVNWVGNLLSKAILVITKDGSPTEEQAALDAKASLFGGPEGQSEMLRLLGIHFTVAGEAYLVGVNDAESDEEDEWMIVASTELSKQGGTAGNERFMIYGEPYDNPMVVRLWRAHPRKAKLADAPSRAIIPILSEIDQLTKHVSAQVDSRLAGAGMLLLPSEISFAQSPSEDGKAAAASSESLVATLIDTMSTAIADREDASALVPIILQAAGEHLDKIKHLTFWTELDEKAIELRAEAIRRLALGMDMPPEILTGTAEMNHWGSWQVEEASIKAHTEPLLAVIISALNKGYLWPLLMSDGSMTKEEAQTYSFQADTSKMRLRPNRSAEAMELYDRGVLSKAALLRENGFEGVDLMDEKELAEWFRAKVASGSTTPELVEAALVALNVINAAEVPQKVIQPRAEEDTQEARPTRSLENHPRRDPPELDPLTASAEVMVHRALERAGNRLRTKLRTKVPGVSAAETYQFVPVDAASIDDLLEDAWSIVPQFACGTDPIKLAECLDTYTRALLTERTPHSTEMLESYLTLAKGN